MVDSFKKAGKYFKAVGRQASGTVVTFAFYDIDGDALTLAEGDRLAIDQAVIISSAGGDTYIFYDVDGGGSTLAGNDEIVVRGTIDAGGGVISQHFGIPLYSEKRTSNADSMKLYGISGSGVIDGVVIGRVLEASEGQA